MELYLIVISIIILICIFFTRISNKVGVPVLFAFILLGIFFGSDGVVKIPFDDFSFAEKICSVALAFIMFYGGFGTNWKHARPVVVQSVLLSTLGVILTAAFTGLFCHYVLKMGWIESFLLGSVIGSTDAASVFSILRSKKLGLKYNTASLLEVESGSNDPSSYTLTIMFLSIMQGGVSAGKVIYIVFAQVFFGIVIGVSIAYLATFILKRVKFSVQGFDTIFVFAFVLFAYSAVVLVGGNGYLSVYLCGIILGNSRIPNKKPLVNFFDGVTGIMQMLVFFLLGLLSFPSKFPSVVLPALIIALFITFIGRPLAVAILLTPFKSKLNQQALISFAGFRGASSIVFAIAVMVSAVPTERDIFHTVFCIVLFSIIFQGSLFPFVSKKLNMVSKHENVMKTFNDYVEDTPVRFIQLTVTENHPWVSKHVKDIILPPETLFVRLSRGAKKITPTGRTTIKAGDILTLSAVASQITDDISLSEITLDKENQWIGKRVSEIDLEDGKLVIMIERGHQVVIPSGKTILHEGDILVINEDISKEAPPINV
ncbi:MAG: potassium/proton antiporter [Clostridiales bacterium]|nr:potassium/proton antiporter [Clostridiales bacterium]